VRVTELPRGLIADLTTNLSRSRACSRPPPMATSDAALLLLA
jgi:hypothetical protein